MRRAGRLRALALIGASLLALGADPPGDEEPAAAAGTPEPAAIALTDVAARAEQTQLRLRDIARALAPAKPVRAIEDALQSRAQDLATQARAARARLALEHTRRVLDDVEFQWSGHVRELSAWNKTLTKRAGELEEIRAGLDAEAALWKRSALRAREQKAPAAVAARIAEIRTQIGETASAADQALGDVLTLQNRIGEELVVAGEMIDSLNALRERVRETLLEPDAPPLWRALSAPRGALSLRDEVRASFARDAALVREFTAQSRLGLVALPVSFAAALFAARALRRRVASWSDSDPALGRAGRVFDRPIAAALLVAWFAAVAANPAAPVAARNLAGVLFLAPLLRVLQLLVKPALLPAVYALAAFSLVDRLRDSLAGVTLLARSIFAAELVAALVCLAALLREPRLQALGGRRFRSLRLAARTAALLLGAALLGNLAGYVDFGELLGDGTLGTAYLGVALYAGMRLAQVGVRVALETPAARRVQLLRRRSERISSVADRALRWAAAALAGFGALELFDLRQPVFSSARALLTTPLEIGTVAISLGDLAAFGISIAAAFGLAGAIRALLEDEVFPRVSLPRGVPNAVASASRYAILLLGFLFAVAAAGVDLSQFVVLAGAFGVGIGFGLQNVVNNFISGLILLFERPVQVGDHIEFGGQLGEVRRIGIRSSTVRTWQGAEVILPNADLISNQLVNWTLSDRQRRVDLPVGVVYGADPERVLALLLEVARANPDVLGDPAPTALFVGFGASSLDFELRVWTSNFRGFLGMRSAIATAVYAALREAGIEIPFPQQDLHVKSVSPELGELLRPR